MDDLDWRTISPMKDSPGAAEQKGYKYMLCVLDRATRKLWVEALKSKTVGETVAALRKILADAGATETIKEMSMDSASEFLSADMRSFLGRLGPNPDGVTIHVKAPDRASRKAPHGR